MQAKAQKLGEQVQSLTARVKELEAALHEAQRLSGSISQQSASSIPQPESLEPDGRVQGLSESIGSMSISEEGATKYYGSTSSSEVCCLVCINLVPDCSNTIIVSVLVTASKSY